MYPDIWRCPTLVATWGRGAPAQICRNGRLPYSPSVPPITLAVVASDAFSVTPETPHAIRVSLGAVPGRAELVRGLDILAAALGNAPPASQVI